MDIFAAIGKKGGMMFFKRRVTKDQVFIDYIIEKCDKRNLYMNEYSKELFCDKDNIIVDENFLDIATNDGCCFVENVDIADYTDKIDRIYLCDWGRKYPATFYFDINVFDDPNWKFITFENLIGKSHDSMVVFIFENRNK